MITCYICGEPIMEGERVIALDEGFWMDQEVVDREWHYTVHTRCFYEMAEAGKERKDA